MAPNFLENTGFLEILLLRPKIFGLLLFEKIKFLSFIGKLLNLALPDLQANK